jgi:ParB family chromosome partitioning protein
MAKWWTATPETYFNRVRKPLIEEAVKEADAHDAARRIVGMKKGEAARAAAKALEGTGWLPSLLRTPPVE